MPVAGAYLISPDGKTRKMFTERSIPAMLDQGWTVASGQTIGTESRHAPGQRITGESFEAQARYGDIRPMVPARQMHEEAVELEREREFSGRTGEALLYGAARGLSVGLSDPLLTGLGIVEPETLEGLEEYNRPASMTGEIGSMLVGGIGALGKGAAGAALRATPAGALAAKTAKLGERGTGAFIAANAGEAGLYGVGHNLSQIAIHNEELTAESLVVDSLSSGIKTGLLGGAGAAAFAGAGKAYRAVKGLRKAKAPEAPVFDVTTPEGAAFLGKTADSLNDSLKFGDHLQLTTDPKSIEAALAKESGMAEWEAYSKAHADDVMSRAKAYRDRWAKKSWDEPVVPAGAPDVQGHAKRIEALEDELGRAMRGPDFPAGGLMAKESEDIAEITGRAASLEEHMSARAAGDLPFSAPRHPDEIVEELKALRKAEPESRVSAEAQAAYEDALDDYVTKVAERDLQVSAVDDALQAVARQKSFMQEARKAGRTGGAMADDLSFGAGKVPPRTPQDVMGKTGAARFQPDEHTSEYIANLRRVIGDAEEEVVAFEELAKQHMREMNYAKTRMETPIPAATKTAQAEYKAATADLRKSVGANPTMQSVAKALNGEPEEIVGFVSAMSRHFKAAEDLAHLTGDKSVVKMAQDNVKKVSASIKESLPVDIAKDVGHLDLSSVLGLGGVADLAFLNIGDREGMLDEFAKVALMYGFLRKGSYTGGMIEKAAGSVFSRGAKSVVGAAGAGASRSVVKGGSLPANALRSAMGALGYQGASKAMGAADLYRASGKATSQVSQAVNRMLKGTVKKGMGATGSHAMMKALKISEEGKRERKAREKSLQELFKSKRERLLKLTQNPMALAEMMYDHTAALRAAHPTLGDKVEVTMGEDLKYIADRMPKDPGTQHMLGISTWEPDDFAIHKFGQLIQGIVDPMSVVDGVTNNSVSMVAAQALRDRRPAMFNQLGLELARRAPELQKKLSYDQLNNLAILMGQPMSSVTDQDYIKFIVAKTTEAKKDETASMRNVDANALINGTPTQAQQLLRRGTE